MTIDTAKLKAAAPYQSRFSRLWERFDEASHGNAEHMRDILEVTLDALETAERHIFKADSETLELISALEAMAAAHMNLQLLADVYRQAYEEARARIAELEACVSNLQVNRPVVYGDGFYDGYWKARSEQSMSSEDENHG